MRVAFYVSSGQKGVVLSVVSEILKIPNLDAFVIARNADVCNLVNKLIPDLSKSNIINLSKLKDEVKTNGDIIGRAMHMEDILEERCGMLSSYDRAIGQGYLGNADRHPHIIRSLYLHKEKLIQLVEDFEMYEKLVDICNAEIFFGWQRPFILSMLLKSKGISYITYSHSRIGDKFMFVRDEKLQNDCLIDSIKDNIDNFSLDMEVKDIRYKPTETFTIGMSNTTYSIFSAIRDSIYKCVHEFYKVFKGSTKYDSYKFCGWIPVQFRKIFAIKYWNKHGIKVNDISDMRTVIFPLHMEPEISLLQVSPEFNNSYEIICWISKNLPADTALVVKENPWSFGIRSKEYYERLRKISNVELAHPSTNTREWIKRSIFTVAITGTAGFESIYYNKPVLSYGKYQIINFLPTAYYVDSFFTTKKAVNNILNIKSRKNLYLKSKYILHRSILSCSFSLPNMAKYHKSNTLVEDLGKILCKEFYSQYILKMKNNESR